MEQKGLDIFEHDCANCFGFCCSALRIDERDTSSGQKVHFETKPAMQPCRYLTENFQCAIHDQLLEKGARTCSEYRCFSAGNFVAELFAKYAIKIDPMSLKGLFDENLLNEKLRFDCTKLKFASYFFYLSHSFFGTLFAISQNWDEPEDEKLETVFEKGKSAIAHILQCSLMGTGFAQLDNIIHKYLYQILQQNFPKYKALIENKFPLLSLKTDPSQNSIPLRMI